LWKWLLGHGNCKTMAGPFNIVHCFIAFLSHPITISIFPEFKNNWV
jgi:hypothetical protein